MSRNFTSAKSSIRAPFSEMLPVRLGVSILTRGVAAIAVSRLTTGAAAAAGEAAGALEAGAGGALVCGAVAGVVGFVEGRLGEFRLDLALRALLFHLRHVVEILPGKQHEAG